MRKRALPLIAAIFAALCVSSVARADAVTENTNFIEKAYMDLLGRTPSALEIAAGLGALGSETHYQFALSLDTRTEYYQLLSESYFQGLLGRAPTSTELSFEASLLASTTDESVQAALAGSAEFFSKSGGTNAGFIVALFQDFLGRAPSSAEVAFWESALATMSRDQVAALILGTTEYESDLVKSYYLEFLQRPADPTGLTFFISALNGNTLTDEQVIASLIGTDEYFELAQATSTTPTPEPGTMLLAGLGIAGMILLRKQLG